MFFEFKLSKCSNNKFIEITYMYIKIIAASIKTLIKLIFYRRFTFG